MGNVILSLVLCLTAGLAGALGAYILGTLGILVMPGGYEPGEAMGRAVLVIFYLVPAGFILGLVAGDWALMQSRP